MHNWFTFVKFLKISDSIFGMDIYLKHFNVVVLGLLLLLHLVVVVVVVLVLLLST